VRFIFTYDGRGKLATTATGIDVVGTATMDGLTVDVASGSEGAKFSTNDATAANNAGILVYNIASATAATRNSQLILDPSGANASGGDYLIISAKGDNSASIINYHATSTLALGTGGIERMRIDSSGTLLAGKTAASSNTVGFETSANGTCAITRSGGQPLLLNRQTSDGDIILLRKDGTTVGSIGTNSNTTYIDGSSANTGLQFAGSTIAPRDSGALSDAGVDLGNGSYRFKDLYLSGGVYLGGTGAANHLDDYEEGTWTPVIADAATGGNVAAVGASLGSYTKVGNLVTVGCNLSDINISGLTSSNAIYIRGLPFVTGTTQIRSGSAFLDRVTFSGYVTAYATGSHVLLFNTATGANDAALPVSSIDTTGSDVFFTITYQV
jgi:hypothetical protein